MKALVLVLLCLASASAQQQGPLPLTLGPVIFSLVCHDAAVSKPFIGKKAAEAFALCTLTVTNHRLEPIEIDRARGHEAASYFRVPIVNDLVARPAIQHMHRTGTWPTTARVLMKAGEAAALGLLPFRLYAASAGTAALVSFIGSWRENVEARAVPAPQNLATIDNAPIGLFPGRGGVMVLFAEASWAIATPANKRMFQEDFSIEGEKFTLGLRGGTLTWPIPETLALEEEKSSWRLGASYLRDRIEDPDEAEAWTPGLTY